MPYRHRADVPKARTGTAPPGRHRRVLLAISVVLVLVGLAACGGTSGTGAAGDGGGGDGGGGGAGGGPFPTTVATKFGDVTVERAPQRVVAVGWGDAETALALGVQPVGASDWLDFGGVGVGPWAADRYTTPPRLLGTQQLDYEAVAALRPDLILDTRSSGDRARFDTLSRIAPTIAPPPGLTATYGTTWRQQMTMVAQALGRPAEGAAQIAALEEKFRAAAAANPQFAGKTVAAGAYFGGRWGAYVSGDQRVEFLKELGFRAKPEIDALGGGSFYTSLSGEQVGLLSADLTVVFPISGGSAADLRADPVLRRTPAARAGHLVVLDDPTTIAAFSSGTTLGTAAAIDRAVPLFARALRR